ncbi:hypothetical protein M153_2500047491 [Pseudoloma neurophilia]|uniref:Uncharacterized protein n=1 Tax=Pseudoloma neurophilia TaxID=146866 RepID=A0A0R0M1D7_9MICR|nr:hypothetical protein M153_2500047491 [Pseudoloma neurophilia]
MFLTVFLNASKILAEDTDVNPDVSSQNTAVATKTDAESTGLPTEIANKELVLDIKPSEMDSSASPEAPVQNVTKQNFTDNVVPETMLVNDTTEKQDVVEPAVDEKETDNQEKTNEIAKPEEKDNKPISEPENNPVTEKPIDNTQTVESNDTEEISSSDKQADKQPDKQPEKQVDTQEEVSKDKKSCLKRLFEKITSFFYGQQDEKTVDSTTLEEIKDSFGEKTVDISEDVEVFLVNAVENVEEEFDTAVKKSADWIEGKIDTTEDFLQDIVSKSDFLSEEAKEDINEWIEDAGNKFEDFVEKTEEFLKKGGDLIADGLEDAIHATQDFIEDIFESEESENEKKQENSKEQNDGLLV